MTYRVLWIQTALDELASLWTSADSAMRAEINHAALHIDHQLARDPFTDSESRDPGEWIYFSEPLGVLFEIENDIGRFFR